MSPFGAHDARGMRMMMYGKNLIRGSALRPECVATLTSHSRAYVFPRNGGRCAGARAGEVGPVPGLPSQAAVLGSRRRGEERKQQENVLSERSFDSASGLPDVA